MMYMDGGYSWAVVEPENMTDRHTRRHGIVNGCMAGRVIAQTSV
jgi:hypothetical protein